MSEVDTKTVVVKKPKLEMLGENPAATVQQFKAEMPVIPGVADKRQQQIWNDPSVKRAALILGIVFLVGGGAWWGLHGRHAQPVTAPADIGTSAVPMELPEAQPVPVHHSSEIGTTAELEHPWSSKKFSYFRPTTQEEVPAVAIRLPSGDGHSIGSYWVILLKAPYGQCNLDYIADTKDIANRFGYAATHPMIADTCSGTLYDPMRTGTLPDGTWARGEIVHGAGFRPPFQIELHIEGDKLVAGRAEQ